MSTIIATTMATTSHLTTSPINNNVSGKQQQQQKQIQYSPNKSSTSLTTTEREKWVRLVQLNGNLYFGNYRLGQTLGEGEFGKVKLAYACTPEELPFKISSPSSLQTNGISYKQLPSLVLSQKSREFAIKFIRKSILSNENRKDKLLKEISIMQSMPTHKHIIRLFEVLESEKYIGLVMEYASGGELFNHILAKKHLSDRESRKLFLQLIDGVRFMHDHQIVHRDLKLENLLLDSAGDVKITDFGFANFFQQHNLMATSCGSPCYAAPELVLSDSYYGPTADVWSCGVILYAMLCGYLPFDDDPMNPESSNVNLLYKYILRTELQFPHWVSESACDLIRNILKPDPSKRFSFDQILAHRWVQMRKTPFAASNSVSSLNSESSKAFSIKKGRDRAMSAPVAPQQPLPQSQQAYPQIPANSERKPSIFDRLPPFRSRFSSFNSKKSTINEEEHGNSDEDRNGSTHTLLSTETIPSLQNNSTSTIVSNGSSNSSNAGSPPASLANFVMNLSLKNDRSVSNAESVNSMEETSSEDIRIHRGAVDPKLVFTEDPEQVVDKLIAAMSSVPSLEIIRKSKTCIECLWTATTTTATPQKNVNGKLLEPTDNNYTEKQEENTEEKENTTTTMTTRPRSNSNNVMKSLGKSIKTSITNGFLGTLIKASCERQQSVKFVIQVVKIGDFAGVYCLDVKRLKGNHRNFKTIYQLLVDNVIQLVH